VSRESPSCFSAYSSMLEKPRARCSPSSVIWASRRPIAHAFADAPFCSRLMSRVARSSAAFAAFAGSAAGSPCLACLAAFLFVVAAPLVAFAFVCYVSRPVARPSRSRCSFVGTRRPWAGRGRSADAGRDVGEGAWGWRDEGRRPRVPAHGSGCRVS
jgi:hypothetical protein